MWRIAYWWKCLLAYLMNEKVCPYCRRVTELLRVCPTCHVGQCIENCYPYPPSPGSFDGVEEGDQCGACEYPEG